MRRCASCSGRSSLRSCWCGTPKRRRNMHRARCNRQHAAESMQPP
jgi:hypothetical protein